MTESVQEEEEDEYFEDAEIVETESGVADSEDLTYASPEPTRRSFGFPPQPEHVTEVVEEPTRDISFWKKRGHAAKPPEPSEATAQKQPTSRKRVYGRMLNDQEKQQLQTTKKQPTAGRPKPPSSPAPAPTRAPAEHAKLRSFARGMGLMFLLDKWLSVKSVSNNDNNKLQPSKHKNNKTKTKMILLHVRNWTRPSHSLAPAPTFVQPVNVSNAKNAWNSNSLKNTIFCSLGGSCCRPSTSSSRCQTILSRRRRSARRHSRNDPATSNSRPYHPPSPSKHSQSTRSSTH
eukprot:GABV01000511.1.p1 GENE.GABV01000511.1~~GABV01000511.1.p1  ORF type:complete len:289 (-),score=64.29 GABV01000511.1:230-1096(-)